MKGDLSLKILEVIGQAAISTGDIIAAILTSPYGASVGRMESSLRKMNRERSSDEIKYFQQQRYYNAIYWLKRDGLLEKSRSGKLLKLSIKGKEKLKALREIHKFALPSRNYQAESTPGIVIVAFDVPEKERQKRNWLRARLRTMGLQMIQKSLWFGRKKLPREFLEDIRSLKMTEYIEIFEISRSGTLRHLTYLT